LCSRLDDLARGADVVIFADYGFGTLTDVTVREAVSRVRPHVPVVAGGVGNPHLDGRGLERANLLALTEKSLRTRTADYDGSLPSTAQACMRRLGVGRLMVTTADAGTVLFRPREERREHWFRSRLRSEYLPPLSSKVIDRMGVNEAVLAAGTLALRAEASWPLCGYLAAACAALEAEHLGPRPVSAGELLRWLQFRPEIAQRRVEG
jgi:bifunctional ADP-heptose synthase (sugar kinase/adenylyltransferase)